MAEKDITKFKYQLGYEFKNKELLKEALTHRSFAVERKLKYDNQRLEFLGDAVIEILLTEYLFNRYQDEQEGILTKMRSALVKQGALAELARDLDLGDFLRMGKGEKEAMGAERDSTLCDLFEATIGAFYLDAGLESVREFLIPLIEKRFPDPALLLTTLNPKGALQEYTQKKFGIAPVYELIESSGPDHMPSYTYAALIKGKQWGTGNAHKRKTAESIAADEALKALKKQ